MSHPLIVRPSTPHDAAATTRLLNAIVRIGGTTAMEMPLTEADSSEDFIDGSHVFCGHVAVDPATQEVVVFRALERHATSDRIDIATFVRQQPRIAGVGTWPFAVTRRRARTIGLSSIVSQRRADNRHVLAHDDRMGFVTCETLRAVPLRDGSLVDRVRKRFVVG